MRNKVISSAVFSKQSSPLQTGNNYVVITPAFNEQENIGATIHSMISQKVRPQVWIIVDDGSTDGTWKIIKSSAKLHSWIIGIRKQNIYGPKEDGLISASEAVAFLDGLKLALNVFPNPNYIVKLDADLQFSEDYFAQIFARFHAAPELGIAGGIVYEKKGAKLVRDKINKAHVRGATKIYRRECYYDIGGIRPVFGWDVVDEMFARASGWNVASLEHIYLVHLRRTASRNGRFIGWARNGYMAYYIGMSPMKMIIRSLYRLIIALDPIQSCGLAYGYFSKYIRRSERIPDSQVRRLVRQYQWGTVPQH